LNLFPIPQECFSLPSLKKFSKRIKFISNPSLLEFDGDLTFQLFNSNIIDDLRAQSLFKIPITQNRIDPCLTQLINQKTLAPLYPMTHPVDLRKYQQLRLDEKPNFLIIPSQIGNGFAKVYLFHLKIS
jgi:DNA polymerase II small subunit/DNA polymerase delta subunit B